MYRKILIGYDGTDQAEDALALARLLAGTSSAELHLASVFMLKFPLRGGFAPIPGAAETELAKQLADAASAAGAFAQPVQSTSPARGLHELAEELEADLVVVGSSQHGRMGQTLLGNVAVTLMHGSPCAVAVAPRGYAAEPDRQIATVVVGYDGSAESRIALEAACELAAGSGASLKLVSAADEPPVFNEIEEEARERLEQARDSVPEGIEVDATVVAADPVEALADAAAAPGSILMLGSRAYGPLRRVLLGSVSRRLAEAAPAPLIVHPRGMHEAPETTPVTPAKTTA